MSHPAEPWNPTPVELRAFADRVDLVRRIMKLPPLTRGERLDPEAALERAVETWKVIEPIVREVHETLVRVLRDEFAVVAQLARTLAPVLVDIDEEAQRRHITLDPAGPIAAAHPLAQRVAHADRMPQRQHRT